MLHETNIHESRKRHEKMKKRIGRREGCYPMQGRAAKVGVLGDSFIVAQHSEAIRNNHFPNLLT